MLKKIGSFLLIAVMLMAVLTPLTIVAAQSGKCGDNLTWTLDDAGTLTIAGSGDMWNWELGGSPWSSFKTPINRVVIIYGVTSIGNYAFYACNLTAISIPQSVTSIGDGAFDFCKILTSINIPSSVTSIGERAFSFCDRLVAIFVDDNNQNYCSINGVLFSKDKKIVLCYPAGKREANYTIHEGVTDIGEYAFFCCKSLTSISIPSSVTTIEDWAFAFCDSLMTISIPPCVKSIGEYVFYSCDSLTTINIPSSVTSIGDGAFGWCESLTSINIPSSVTSIGDGAFSYCDSLVAILVNSSNTEYSNDEYGVLFNKNKTKIIQYPNGRKETTYTIPSSVTSIGNNAFEFCKGLTSISIPSSVTSIGEEAFSYCDSLTSISIPDSVTSIGEEAFSYCDSLTSIKIPFSVTYIGGDAFYKCRRLTDIYYAGSEAMWETLAKDVEVPDTTKVHYYSVAPGTVIGSALRTNITAAINGHAIPSFNVDGYTYIVAEDLKDYGFAVYFDNSTRTLAINRDNSKTDVTRNYVKPYVPKSEVGIKEHNIVATDIVTYLDNNYAQSYNINGLTIIPFNELGRYGAVYYDNATRVISVTIPGLN